MFELTKNLMKRTNLLIALLLLAASSVFWKCGDSAPPPVNPQDAQLAKITKTWKSTGVKYATTGEPQPVTGYENFVITISGTAGNPVLSYSTTGRPTGPGCPWAASGTLTFGTDFATVLIRDDLPNNPITYSASATQLQLNFEYVGSGFAGRVGNAQGSWVFNFEL